MRRNGRPTPQAETAPPAAMAEHGDALQKILLALVPKPAPEPEGLLQLPPQRTGEMARRDLLLLPRVQLSPQGDQGPLLPHPLLQERDAAASQSQPTPDDRPQEEVQRERRSVPVPVSVEVHGGREDGRGGGEWESLGGRHQRESYYEEQRQVQSVQ